MPGRKSFGHRPPTGTTSRVSTSSPGQRCRQTQHQKSSRVDHEQLPKESLQESITSNVKTSLPREATPSALAVQPDQAAPSAVERARTATGSVGHHRRQMPHQESLSVGQKQSRDSPLMLPPMRLQTFTTLTRIARSDRHSMLSERDFLRAKIPRIAQQQTVESLQDHLLMRQQLSSGTLPFAVPNTPKKTHRA